MNTLLINLLSITPMGGNVLIGLISIILCVGGCGCLMPIIIAIQSSKENKHKIDKQTEVLREAIQKGGTENINVAEIVGAFDEKKKTLKLTIIKNLKSGLICSLIGICLILVSCFAIIDRDLINVMYVGGGILLAVGIALIVIAFISKRYLAKEIEAEEKKLSEK